MTDPAPRLATAIHHLTRPHTTTVTQRPAGGGRRTVTLQHEPLILLLQNSATSTGASYGGSAPQSRNIVDTDTLTKLADLRGDITRSWHRLSPGVAPLLPLHRAELVDALTGWHRLFAAHLTAELVDDTTLERETRTYTGWAHTIRAKFDPPRQKEATVPCPECGQRWTTPGDLEDRTAALMFILTGSPDTLRATCRVCGTSWTGREELLKLGAALEHPEKSAQRPARHAHRTSVPHETAESALH